MSRRPLTCGQASGEAHLWTFAGSLRWRHGRLAHSQRGLLRPRQDDHRQVEHDGVQQAVPGRRPHLPPRGAALDVRPVRLRPRRRRPRPDGEDAGVHVHAGRRLGRRHGPRDRGGHAAQRRGTAGLRRGGQPHRGAQARRPRHRDRLHERHRGRRADRRPARRGHRGREPARGGRRQVHRQHRLLRVRRREGQGDRGAGRAARLRPRGQLRLQRLGHRPADAGGGGPRHMWSTRTRSSARLRRPTGGRSWSSPSRSRCAAGCRPSRRLAALAVGGVVAVGGVLWANARRKRLGA